MVWTEEKIGAAVAELRDDPEKRGYAAMSDKEVAADMAKAIWQRPQAEVDIRAASVAARLTVPEMTAWRTSANEDFKTSWQVFIATLSSDGAIRGDRVLELVADLGQAGASLVSADSTTKVVELFPKISRSELLGLPGMTDQRVADVRRWIRG